MSKTEFTHRDVPTQTGYYWLLRGDEDEPEVVYVGEADNEECLVVFHCDGATASPIYHYAQDWWRGPLDWPAIPVRLHRRAEPIEVVMIANQDTRVP